MPDYIFTVLMVLGGQFLLYALGWSAYAILIRDDRQAAGYWALFNVLVGSGLLLLWTRDETRGWIAYVGSSILIVSAFMAGWRGITAFTRTPQPNRIQLCSLLIVYALLLYAGPGTEHATLRVVVTYLGSAVFTAMGIYTVGPLVRKEFRGTSWLLRLASLAPTIWLAINAVLPLARPDTGSVEVGGQATILGTGYALFLITFAAAFNFSCLAMQIQRYLKRLNQLTLHDTLTDLFNRRAFSDFGQREWKMHDRKHTPLALAVFDLDHFKQVNDNFGHEAGDQVLVYTARVLKEVTRETDIVARIGGEEFVVLMPDTTFDKALQVLERLRQTLADTAIPVPGAQTINVTTSVGVALAEPGDSDIFDILRRADQALYQSKHAGRNRVTGSAAQ